MSRKLVEGYNWTTVPTSYNNPRRPQFKSPLRTHSFPKTNIYWRWIPNMKWPSRHKSAGFLFLNFSIRGYNYNRNGKPRGRIYVLVPSSSLTTKVSQPIHWDPIVENKSHAIELFQTFVVYYMPSLVTPKNVYITRISGNTDWGIQFRQEKRFISWVSQAYSSYFSSSSWFEVIRLLQRSHNSGESFLVLNVYAPRYIT